MEFNTCGTCGAKNGRAGLLIATEKSNRVFECMNCHDTRESGEITIHTNLSRTDAEIEKTMKILDTK
jgi:hypothetical protein